MFEIQQSPIKHFNMFFVLNILFLVFNECVCFKYFFGTKKIFVLKMCLVNVETVFLSKNIWQHSKNLNLWTWDYPNVFIFEIILIIIYIFQKVFPKTIIYIFQKKVYIFEKQNKYIKKNKMMKSDEKSWKVMKSDEKWWNITFHHFSSLFITFHHFSSLLFFAIFSIFSKNITVFNFWRIFI